MLESNSQSSNSEKRTLLFYIFLALFIISIFLVWTCWCYCHKTCCFKRKNKPESKKPNIFKMNESDGFNINPNYNKKFLSNLESNYKVIKKNKTANFDKYNSNKKNFELTNSTLEKNENLNLKTVGINTISRNVKNKRNIPIKDFSIDNS